MPFVPFSRSAALLSLTLSTAAFFAFIGALPANAQIALPSAATAPTAVVVEGGNHGPAGVCFGPDGKLFVAQAYEDAGGTHGPVLVYASVAALLANPGAPMAVIGGAGQAGNPAGFLYNPEAVATDSSGNLAVSDTQGHRVMIFKPPFSTGMQASIVLGQANFSGNGANAGGGRAGMNFPRGLGFDSSGNLLVADDYNGRVLRFKRSGNAAQPFTNHQSADLEVDVPGGAQNTKAVGVWGNDFVVDSYYNQRFYLYRWNGAGYAQDGSVLNPSGNAIDLAVLSAAAHGANEYPRVVVSIHDPTQTVLGYEPALWTNNTPAQNYQTAPTKIKTPLGVAVDSSGNMVVADYDNSRLLVWKASSGGGGGGSAASSAITSWGYDGDAQSKVTSNKPGGSDFIAVGAGYGTGFAVHADGSLAAWGRDDRGQVSKLPGGTGYTQVVGSEYQGYGLKSDGSITTWGDTSYSMYVAPGGTGYTQIAAGLSNGAALRQDGSIVVWGDNSYKQISNIPAGTGYKQVAVGNGVCYALTADGTIQAWGRDDLKQVSNAPGGNGYTSIASAFYTGFALRGDGSIAAWGGNGQGQVAGVPGGTGYKQIAVGSGMVCALAADGSVVVWAKNGTINPPAGNGFTQIAVAMTTGFGVKGGSSGMMHRFPRGPRSRFPGVIQRRPRAVR